MVDLLFYSFIKSNSESTARELSVLHQVSLCSEGVSVSEVIIVHGRP